MQGLDKFPDEYGNNFILGINGYFCRDGIIRNNVVHNICATATRTYIDGIMLTGSTTQRGANEWVYNNMVYDIRNRVPQSVDLNGIGAWYQDSARVDFNSVYLSPGGSMSAGYGSAALGFYSTASNSTARNNILVNAREEGLGVALAIWFGGSNWKLSAYNDLYVGAFDSSFAAYYGGKPFKTLSALQTDGKELHSVSIMPAFLGPEDLHLPYAISPLADGAVPVAGIATDIDGNPRPWMSHPFPDIGADEFDHYLVDVRVESDGIPIAYALGQNYPNPFNPTTTIRYELPRSSDLRLSVSDLLGREVAVLVNERREPGVYDVTFDASGLSSGFYFYRLTAGSYVQTRKLLLVK